MASFNRTVIQEFAIANILYANAKVTAYTVDSNGDRTSTLATLYEDITGSGTVENPQILDGEGKWRSPVYIDEPAILLIEGAGAVPDHETGVVGGQLAVDVQAAIDAANESRRNLKLAQDVLANLQASFEDLSALNTFHRTGDGSTKTFSIDTEIPTVDAVLVTINGVVQHPDTYTVDGVDVTFSTAPSDNADIAIRVLGISRDIGKTEAQAVSYTAEFTGATTLNLRDHLDAQQLPSLSALQTAFAPSDVFDGQIAYMAGRASVGDGGEGHFRWDGSDLSTEVGNDEVTANEGDGGIYVAPSSDKSGASGAWVRQISGDGHVYAAWYGVTTDTRWFNADNGPDRTVELQAALTGAGERMLVLPAGGFRTTATVTLSSKLAGLIGQGKFESTIYIDGSHNCLENNSNNAPKTFMAHFGIRGGDSNSGAKGIYMSDNSRDLSNVHYTDLNIEVDGRCIDIEPRVFSAKWESLRLKSFNSGIAFINTSNTLLIDNCYFIDCPETETMLKVLETVSGNFADVTLNTTNFGTCGTALDLGLFSTNIGSKVTIHNCNFEGFAIRAIYGRYEFGGTISETTFFANPSDNNFQEHIRADYIRNRWSLFIRNCSARSPGTRLSKSNIVVTSQNGAKIFSDTHEFPDYEDNGGDVVTVTRFSTSDSYTESAKPITAPYFAAPNPTFSLDDDTATSIAAPDSISFGKFSIIAKGGRVADCFFDVSGSDLTIYAQTGHFTSASGSLSGTTGNDGDLTISADSSGNIYVENRTGVKRFFVYMFGPCRL